MFSTDIRPSNQTEKNKQQTAVCLSVHAVHDSECLLSIIAIALVAGEGFEPSIFGL